MNVQVLSAELLGGLSQRANDAPRKRQHLNIHRDYEDPCQRFLNAIGTDSYIRPHRHALDPKAETIFAVRGLFALVVFDDAGAIARIEAFGTEGLCGNAGVELAASTWHTVLALTPGAVALELKAGPFDPQAAKEPAPWSPEEGGPDAAAYLDFLKDAVARVTGARGGDKLQLARSA
jgi:cupin fold WbuC family metalloprotein